MSVELARSHGPTAVNRGSAGRSTSETADPVNGAGTFLAALSAADDAAPDGPGAGRSTIPAADFAQPLDDAQSASVAPDASSSQPPAAPVDSAMLLAQSGLSGIGVASTASEEAGSAEPGLSRGSTAVSGIACGASPSGHTNAAVTDSSGSAMSTSTRLLPHAVAGANSGDAPPEELPTLKTVPSRLATQDEGVRPSLRLLSRHTPMEPATGSLAARSLPAPGEFGRSGERKAERATGLFAVQGFEPGGGSAPANSPLFAPVDAASASAASARVDHAERLVDQMSWWFSQKNQGADFKIEMPGGHPVSVSVQVRGNEAHVVFRSDHAEIRQMLGEAMPQLKHSFGTEGLLLSGVSVEVGADAGGQSDRGEAARHWRSTTPGRDALIAQEPAPMAAGSHPAGSGVSGRALDLYV